VSDRVLWGAAFGRKNAIGDVFTIGWVEPVNLRNHYRRYYVPNNAALIASGDVEASEVFRWAARAFAEWRRGEDPFVEFAPPPIEGLPGDTAFVVEMSGADVTFVLKWQGPSVTTDPDGALVAEVFAEMFNQETSGSQRRLVDSGVFQGAAVGYLPLQYVGPIALTARTSPARLGAALSVIGMELALLGNPDEFDEADVEAAKKSLRVQDAIGSESAAAAAHSLADIWATMGLDGYRGYESRLQGVTLEDVRAFLDRYVVGQPKVVAVLAPEPLRIALTPVIANVVSQWPGSR
jgi:zinc protease